MTSPCLCTSLSFYCSESPRACPAAGRLPAPPLPPPDNISFFLTCVQARKSLPN